MGDPLVDDSWPVGQGMTFTVLRNPLRTLPPHWHTTHDEHHTALKGTLTVIQDGVRRVVRPEDGPLLTRRGVVHSLEILPGEEAIVETTLQSDDVVFYYGDSYPELPTGSQFLRPRLPKGEKMMVAFVSHGSAANIEQFKRPLKIWEDEILKQ
ncbi:hypothetical protein B0H14DRAFT_2559188 [Mycena olivaceomarginata]|nr:hypothetical protein B0H14DRAFT_2559188 [Mycena olivaceomarginata]